MSVASPGPWHVWAAKELERILAMAHRRMDEMAYPAADRKEPSA